MSSAMNLLLYYAIVFRDLHFLFRRLYAALDRLVRLDVDATLEALPLADERVLRLAGDDFLVPAVRVRVPVVLGVLAAAGFSAMVDKEARDAVARVVRRVRLDATLDESIDDTDPPSSSDIFSGIEPRLSRSVLGLLLRLLVDGRDFCVDACESTSSSSLSLTSPSWAPDLVRRVERRTASLPTFSVVRRLRVERRTGGEVASDFAVFNREDLRLATDVTSTVASSFRTLRGRPRGFFGGDSAASCSSLGILGGRPFRFFGAGPDPTSES